MYNGQFLKGVIHAIAFVVLIFLTTKIGILGILIGFFVFYMVFDAYKTAEAIQKGQPLPDPFGLEATFGPSVNQTTWAPPGVAPPGVTPASGPGWTTVPQGSASSTAVPGSCDSNVPIGAVILIGLGFLLLLDNLGWVTFGFHHLWPLILIALGVWSIIKRWNRRVS